MWSALRLVDPPARIGPRPHSDMPDEVVNLYNEAREVAGLSPRSAAALLRLALETLVNSLVESSQSLHQKIGVLVSRGLETQVQQAMDIVRVGGNNGVHPGQIELAEGGELLEAMFELLNLIVEQVIARPKRLASLYEALPAGAREAISRRDGAG